MDTADGLTSARAIFEDSKGRIWVGTNDNGVVVLEGQTRTHLTYLDGLPSSSIRIFEEDPDGNVFIGTTAGICFADSRMKLHEVAGADFSEERILKLDADSAGRIYGQASGGTVFTIDDTAVTAVYSSEALAADKITTLMADPDTEGKVHFGTESGIVYHGDFGVPVNRMDRISIPELGGSVHWLSADCGRVWVSSVNAAGWLDHHRQFHLLDNIPMNSGIEMTTADYQGNLWFASSTQGIMKLVTNNFVDVSREAGIAGEVANAACLYQDALYIGTDTGLEIINAEGAAEQNALTEYIGNARIRDDKRGVFWVVTSNSIEYLQDGTIRQVTSFPYNNNYDIHFDSSGHAWILSSYGVYSVDADEMLHDSISEYSLYTIENGLPYAITANSFSALDADGNLYIPGRNGVISVNIEHYYETNERFRTDVRAIYCDDARIFPDADGVYQLPATRGRIQIAASVMDYTMLNPNIRVYLEGGPDDGITMKRSQLSVLEYTNLPYGDYTLHIQVVDRESGSVLQDDSFRLNKAARITELLVFRLTVVLLLAAAVCHSADAPAQHGEDPHI